MVSNLHCKSITEHICISTLSRKTYNLATFKSVFNDSPPYFARIYLQLQHATLQFTTILHWNLSPIIYKLGPLEPVCNNLQLASLESISNLFPFPFCRIKFYQLLSSSIASYIKRGFPSTGPSGLIWIWTPRAGPSCAGRFLR